jgi:hypothetical protein
MECGDGSGISSRVYGCREDGVMGSLAAWGVAQSDRASVWQAVVVDLFPGVTVRWNSSSSSASFAVGADAVGTRRDIVRHCGTSIGTIAGWFAGPRVLDGEPGNQPEWRL